MNQTVFVDTKILAQFPRNSILKFLLNFGNCVGGALMPHKLCVVPEFNLTMRDEVFHGTPSNDLEMTFE